MNRVVITGAGIISPLGNNVHTFWNQLKQGQSGISILDVDEDYGKTAAGVVHDFDPVEIFGKNRPEKWIGSRNLLWQRQNRHWKAQSWIWIKQIKTG